MTQYRKNILVGVTVLLAAFLLGWMILRFSDAPFKLFAKKQVPVVIVADTAEGLSEGSAVYYLGVGVGRVTAIERASDVPERQRVVIRANVDAEPALPGNLAAKIRTQVVGGGSAVYLILVNPDGSIPTTTNPSGARPAPQGVLKPGQEIVASFVGTELFPREFSDLAESLRKTSDEIRISAQQFREQGIVVKLSKTIDTLQDKINRTGEVLEQVSKLTGDEKLQGDIRGAVANFRDASESASRIGKSLEVTAKKVDTRLDQIADSSNKVLTTAQAHLDDLSKQLGDRLSQTAKVMANLETITQNLADGKGSAGQLINDPRLYENLLDSSKELKLVMSDVRRLLDQWEKEGLPVRLGGK